MDWFKRLPGFQQSPAGVEWWLWRKLPHILAWGTALPVAVAVGWHWAAPDQPSPAQERSLLLVDYVAAGAVVLHDRLRHRHAHEGPGLRGRCLRTE